MPKVDRDADLKPLMAAVVKQAAADLISPQVVKRLDAALFFANGDFGWYADALNFEGDGLLFLINGKARHAAYFTPPQRPPRRKRPTNGRRAPVV